MVLSDEGEDVTGSEPGQGGFAEMGVSRSVVVGGHVQVREIAAPAPGNAYLGAGPLCVFKNEHRPAALGAFHGAHKTRCPGADDDDVFMSSNDIHGLTGAFRRLTKQNIYGRFINYRCIRDKSKNAQLVMLNLFQHLIISTRYETLKRVQGGTFGDFLRGQQIFAYPKNTHTRVFTFFCNEATVFL